MLSLLSYIINVKYEPIHSLNFFYENVIFHKLIRPPRRKFACNAVWHNIVCTGYSSYENERPVVCLMFSFETNFFKDLIL